MTMRYLKIILGFIFCSLLIVSKLCLGANNNLNAKLYLVELKQRTNQTILIFTLKRSTVPTFFTLDNPNRLVVDMPNTNASTLLPERIVSNGLVKQIRVGYGPSGKGNIRLAIDLATKSEFTSLIDHIPDTNIQKITLILRPADTNATFDTSSSEPNSIEDLLPKLEKSNKKHTPSITDAANIVAQGINNEAGTPNQPRSLPSKIKIMQANKIVVMLDPGHGGKDSGAIGPHGIMEKNVVLAISKKIQENLSQNPGIIAKLTRNKDYFIPLRKRINIARSNKADIFIAIHADAFKNDDAQGASVFALSSNGATSEAARWLADRENTSELSGITMKDKDKELKSVLLDMSQTATIQDSLLMGNAILNQLKNFTPLHAQRVEQAAFVVLKSPDIPSLLIETGFITNPKEEALLSNPNYQAKLADAISEGVIDYFKHNPPPDTWFETQYKAPHKM